MMVRTQKFLKNGLAKMFLSNIFTDPDLLERYTEIAQSSLLPLLKGAFFYTIPLSIISFIIGLILAIFTALARMSDMKLLQYIARVYVSLFRGTPLLVQLFIIFYGLPNLNIIIDPFPAAVIGFSLSVGAYGSEIVRAAITSIPKGQWEAGYSIGMSYSQNLRRIILPQAARVSLPPLSNTFISLIKDTSLASMILVVEMFRVAQQIASTNYEFLLLYSEVALLYWLICFPLTIIQQYMEERLSKHFVK
jgi:L-cystine transport system permease protein